MFTVSVVFPLFCPAGSCGGKVPDKRLGDPGLNLEQETTDAN
jgi:hypothetical protein